MVELRVPVFFFSWAYPRKPNQNYVMLLLEPPGTYLSDLKDIPNFFNWTMTYRYDSDIYRPYGYFRPLNGSSKMVDPRETSVQWKQPTMSSDALEEYINLSKRKTKLVAWFVSKCRTQWKREEFVEDLKKYVQVDVYGSFGSMSCSRSRDEECVQMFSSDCKLYLSFENILCEDYVTEKLFRVMKYNIVLGVYVGADYETFATPSPPSSYIDARSFPDVNHSLAELLKQLYRTPEEYTRYFWWKEHYETVEAPENLALCQLCQKMNDPGLQTQDILRCPSVGTAVRKCVANLTSKPGWYMKYNIVPVVYGGVDYERLAPPGTYIDARSFPDARSLAEFLMHLDRTPEEYARYFWWKEHYEVVDAPKNLALCQLCQKLNDPGLKPKTYSDVHQWYSGPEVCYDPHQ